MDIKKASKAFLSILFIISIIYVLVSILIFEKLLINSTFWKPMDEYFRLFFFEYVLFYLLDSISSYLKESNNILKIIFGFLIGTVFSFIYVLINQFINISSNIYNKFFSYVIIILLYLLFISTFIAPLIIKLFFNIKLKIIKYNSPDNINKRKLKEYNNKRNKIIKEHDRKIRFVKFKFKIYKLLIPFIVIVKVLKKIITKGIK